jgi:hypothetical protein
LAPSSLLDYTTFLACVGAAPLALMMIWGLEKVLKRVWRSGLSIALDERGLYVRDRRGAPAVTSQSPAASDEFEQPAMTWGRNLGRLNWYFRLSGYARGGRERRVPAKWFCLATELQQDEARLSVFSFMSSDDMTRFTERSGEHFHLINPAELYDTGVRSRIGPPSRPNIPNHLLQSKDGRYWLAERRRWEYGIELTPEDFATLLDYAQTARRGEPESS